MTSAAEYHELGSVRDSARDWRSRRAEEWRNNAPDIVAVLASHVLLISGSLREGSTNSAAIRTAQQVAPAGMATTIYTGMASLPHFNPDDDREDGPVHPAVANLRAQIGGADAILICTPEYAGGLPGSLRKVLGYVHADIVEPACIRVPVTRELVANDGTITDVAVRERIAMMLFTLADELCAARSANRLHLSPAATRRA